MLVSACLVLVDNLLRNTVKLLTDTIKPNVAYNRCIFWLYIHIYEGHCTASVSYTHLDVYKRQSQDTARVE